MREEGKWGEGEGRIRRSVEVVKGERNKKG